MVLQRIARDTSTSILLAAFLSISLSFYHPGFILLQHTPVYDNKYNTVTYLLLHQQDGNGTKGAIMLQQTYRPKPYSSSHLESIRVFLVDDNEPIRRMVRAWLAPTNLVVVGDASNGYDAVESINRLQPDVVLMDYQMPGMDGLTAARILKERPDAPAVVLYTSDDSNWLASEAIHAGVDALLDKGCALNVLQETLREVARST